ncbi:biotin synthase [Sulfuritortus calidifontis]|uniref:Biotin synthase n=1 Tax=Sulfuritortus calidifontis TaxID=1914471 RepID=A0A4R3JXW8_9PROT|nr:biotin synthase BioB [Sulfuritortus calidifontis]TCS73392.1 biotin synthase [Sulfuritortus calidifontis]
MNDLAENTRIAQDWSPDSVLDLFALPFNDLLFRAQTIHREHFDPNAVQLSTLLSIKTGGCSEDCGYCSQSARHDTHVDKDNEVAAAANAGEAGVKQSGRSQKLLDVAKVVEAAQAAKASGATRFCMGAAWRGPKDKDLEPVLDMVRQVKALGLETCVTLGMLKEGQAEKLKAAGLDYYNHNLDTAPEFYGQVVTTHSYQDRLKTLQAVREAGLSVCCGGIVGMGESRRERAGLIAQLANLKPQPESVPINMLVKIAGTPMAHKDDLDPLEFVRTIAVARITMPASHVRLSAGRRSLSEGEQALCFLAGANSIFYGDKLLTTGNPDVEADQKLFDKLGLKPEVHTERRCAGHD